MLLPIESTSPMLGLVANCSIPHSVELWFSVDMLLAMFIYTFRNQCCLFTCRNKSDVFEFYKEESVPSSCQVTIDVKCRKTWLHHNSQSAFKSVLRLFSNSYKKHSLNTLYTEVVLKSSLVKNLAAYFLIQYSQDKSFHSYSPKAISIMMTLFYK